MGWCQILGLGRKLEDPIRASVTLARSECETSLLQHLKRGFILSSEIFFWPKQHPQHLYSLGFFSEGWAACVQSPDANHNKHELPCSVLKEGSADLPKTWGHGAKRWSGHGTSNGSLPRTPDWWINLGFSYWFPGTSTFPSLGLSFELSLEPSQWKTLLEQKVAYLTNSLKNSESQ